MVGSYTSQSVTFFRKKYKDFLVFIIKDSKPEEDQQILIPNMFPSGISSFTY